MEMGLVMSRATRYLCKVSFVVGLLFFAFCIPAFADSVSYTLNVPNTGLATSLGPYGQITLNLVGNTISVSVSMFGGYGVAGGGPAFGFNGPPGIIASDFTFRTPGFSCCNRSGYGQFQYVINGPPPAGNQPTVLLFTLSAPSSFNNGQGFTSVHQLGNNYMAHVIPLNGANTGYATVGVPDGDPSSLALLGLGLSGLLGLAVVCRTRTRT